MLAKVWKKVLLAICILACIYNVMHKLISRTSLEIQLESVQNQSSIVDTLKNSNNTQNTIEKSSSTDEATNVVDQKETMTNTTNETHNNSIVVIY